MLPNLFVLKVYDVKYKIYSTTLQSHKHLENLITAAKKSSIFSFTDFAKLFPKL